jgi:hypothetical protein
VITSTPATGGFIPIVLMSSPLVLMHDGSIPAARRRNQRMFRQ